MSMKVVQILFRPQALENVWAIFLCKSGKIVISRFAWPLVIRSYLKNGSYNMHNVLSVYSKFCIEQDEINFGLILKTWCSLREHTTIATAMIASAQSQSELSTTIVPLYVKNLDFLLDYKSIFLFVRVLWNVYYMF